MKSWGRNLLRRSYLDEFRAIDGHGDFGIWQWAVSKDHSDISRNLGECCRRGRVKGLMAVLEEMIEW